MSKKPLILLFAVLAIAACGKRSTMDETVDVYTVEAEVPQGKY